jgi:hypothetical protein
MADELTQIDPNIAQLAEYYRSPAEQRPGEGFIKRLGRISLGLISQSKADYDAAQQAKEKLFAANVQLNALKDKQKLARQALDLATVEAEDRMKTSQQRRQQAAEVFSVGQRVRQMMTPLEEKQAVGGVEQWATPAGQELLSAETRAKNAYVDYLRSGKAEGSSGSDLLDTGRLLGIVGKLQSGARTATRGREDMLDTQAKQISSSELGASPDLVGQYAASAYDAYTQLAEDAQPVDLMGKPVPSTVQSGKIPQHYAQAMGQVRTLSDNLMVDTPFWPDKSLTEALHAKLAAIVKDFKVGTPDFDTAYRMATQDLVSRLTGPDAEKFIISVGGPEMALMLVQNAFRPGAPEEMK